MVIGAYLVMVILSVCLGRVVDDYFVFFKQKTAYEMRISDWSSDVCSSDLRLRPENQARLGKSPNRHHLALVVLHVDPIDVVDLRAVVGLGLDVDLPGPAEEIEVVHVIAAERGLPRGKDVIDRHAERPGLLAVDVELDIDGKSVLWGKSV